MAFADLFFKMLAIFFQTINGYMIIIIVFAYVFYAEILYYFCYLGQ